MDAETSDPTPPLLAAVSLYEMPSSRQAYWSCSRERTHPIGNDFAGLIRRQIGERMAQFQPNFEHICDSTLAQLAQEHQARQEPVLS